MRAWQARIATSGMFVVGLKTTAKMLSVGAIFVHKFNQM
jgi:hypothetical protein